MAFSTAIHFLRSRSAIVFRISSKCSSDGLKNVRNISEISKNNSMKFNDASMVFGHKTTRELLRGFFVLHACSFDSLVNRSHDLMRGTERLFGSRLLRVAVAPFYNQFVAGNTEEGVAKVNETLASIGINLMIAPMLETDVGGDSVNQGKLFENNFEKTSFLIAVSSRHRPKSSCRPICQTKLTAHISADCLLRISSKYESLNDLEKRNSVLEWSSAMAKLSAGVTELDNFKCFGVGDKDFAEIRDALTRLCKIGILSVDKDVILAVDAEYSYVNPAINLITLAMKTLFNKDKPVVWNTYQGYLKNSKYWLQHDLQLTKSLGVKFGAKIVRGAYMEKERAHALINNVPNLVHDTYDETNKSYDSLIDLVVPIVAEEPNNFNVMVATHNENSIIHSTQLMKVLGITPKGSSLFFAQIYGMAENISVTLAKHGYHVYKSVPFGSVTETLPYLSRRANENRVVFRGARQEKTLLATEIKNRLLFQNSKK